MTAITQVSAVTRCPHCGAKFRVRAEQVKPHAGLVRCGACRGIFDAVEHLIEGTLPPITTHDDETGDPPRTIIQAMPAVEQPAPAPSTTAAGAPAAPAPSAARTAAPAAPTTTVSSKNPLRIAPSPSPTTDTGKQEVQVRNMDAAGAPSTPATAFDENPAGTATVTSTGETDHYRWRPAPQKATRGSRLAYGLLSVLAIVALSAQGAYFFRDELASRVPAFAPTLAVACEHIGCRLEPPRRTDALGFVGADLAADPAHKGLLVFTATLRNSGQQAVAFPHLILTLDGLSGEMVARKVFTPAEFAPATANLGRGLDGGAEIEVKLYLDASQSNVVGFKIDHAYL
ncbi:DUF3426 domain-containing protein [Casimicrobium huifangae]|uniref:DUF3426 domain-containing protein n=1 Tax=Casimicrobium huifangae TaxID=2591109 RepID=UPI0012ECB2FE|nr:DUF3426 domain-containing protein [Casimicrobium huifangae]